jgi:Mg-chelatase subunit ChlD
MSKDTCKFSDKIDTMKLKIYVPYLLIFLACFLGGLVIAFGWHRIVAKRHNVPLPTRSMSTVSRSAGTTPPPKKSTSTAVTKMTPTATQPSQTVQGLSAAPLKPDALPALQTGQTPTIAPGSDIIMLIDSSGSMKRTDPRGYRKNAAKLFISLLGKNDRIGVMGFGDSATLLRPLTRNTGQNRQVLFDAVEKITSKELYTNITEAVLQGLNELKKSRQRNRIMVMMSDGKIDLGSKEKDDLSHSILTGILPELARKQIPLYTVAFTQESDRALLEHMATATGGSFRFARQDKDVHVMFASIFEKIKSPDAVPFVGDSFTIDPEISEATVLVTKKPGTALSLVDPAGNKHHASTQDAHIAWFESTVFDMITIKEPAVGIWNVKLSSNEGNKVYVLTSLHLKSSFRGRDVMRGKTATIDAWLEKAGGTVLEQALLENTTFSATITGADGKTSTVALSQTSKSGASPAPKGIFSGVIPALAAGNYAVDIVAAGRTFQRRITIPFNVIDTPENPASGQDASHVTQATTPEEVSWLSVLVKFGIINFAVLGLVAAVAGMRIIFIKMRAKR